MEKIYLPNTFDSLKVYSVNYNRSSVFEYIDQKSIELGAKVEKWGTTEPLSYGRILENGERISTSVKSGTMIRRHSFSSGWNPISSNCVDYGIFSDEKPVIKAFVNSMEIKRNCLEVIKNKSKIWEYIWKNYFNEEIALDDFFKSYYIPTLSFETLSNLTDNEDMIKEFVSFFDFQDEGVLNYEDVKNSVFEVFDAARIKEDSFQACFQGTVDTIKDRMLKFVREEFDNTSQIAEHNQKVLSLK